MSFLTTAVPVIFIIIFSILGVVLKSDSKSYLKKVDNKKQMELEKARKDALEMVEQLKKIRNSDENTEVENIEIKNDNIDLKKIKTKRNVIKRSEKIKNKEQTTDQTTNSNFEQKPEVNRYEKYLKQRKEQLKPQNLAYMPENEKNFNNLEKSLVFSKENIVRGLIAKEYLHKRSRGV